MMAVNLTPGQQPPTGGTQSAPKGNDALQSGTPTSIDPTLVQGNYAPSLFGVALPQGTGAPGSQGALPGTADATLEPGQLNEGISGEGPSDTASTGAPGSTGAQNQGASGESISYTRPGSYLTGTYQQDTVTDSVSGTNDWTQAIDGSYGGGPQLPGIAGNMPAGTGAGEGSVLKGGRYHG
jgi:hypothetical protein